MLVKEKRLILQNCKILNVLLQCVRMFFHLYVRMFLLKSLNSILSKNGIFLGEIRKSNFILLCFSFSFFMIVIKSGFALSQVINMSFIYLSYSRNISLMYGQMWLVQNLFEQNGANVVPKRESIMCHQCVQFNTNLFRIKLN